MAGTCVRGISRYLDNTNDSKPKGVSMDNIKRPLFFLVSGILVGAVSNPVSAEYLSAEEVKSLFTNRTSSGHHAFKNEQGSRYFDESGKSSGTTGTGTWRVNKEGMLCVSNDGNSNERCRHISKSGDKYKKYKIRKNVMKGHKHVWTYTKIEDGNPRNFKLAE
jgi:hypothetical protein